jgi:hypothetical protein
MVSIDLCNALGIEELVSKIAPIFGTVVVIWDKPNELFGI